MSDALTIPVGLGEQEFSMRRFQWTIENRVMDIVQPDLHYFGGYIRCTKVARMAAAAGMPCTLHLSESGFAYLNVLHFASYVADPGPFQEFKGFLTGPNRALPCRLRTSIARAARPRTGPAGCSPRDFGYTELRLARKPGKRDPFPGCGPVWREREQACLDPRGGAGLDAPRPAEVEEAR